jgi:hypothetical protein
MVVSQGRARGVEVLRTQRARAGGGESALFPLKLRVERWFGTLLFICFFSLLHLPLEL